MGLKIESHVNSLPKECFHKHRFQPKATLGKRRKRETIIINIKVAYIIQELLFSKLLVAK